MAQASPVKTKAAAKPKSTAKAKAKQPAKKASAVAPIPEGFHTITPSIIVSDGEGAIALYQKALGAEVKGKMHWPGKKKIMHSCLQIGDSKLFLYDETEYMKAPKEGTGGSQFYLYVKDVDAQHKKALQAGMKEAMAPTDMFWGDRISSVICPYGHRWSFATHVKDVSEAEMMEGAKAMMKG